MGYILLLLTASIAIVSASRLYSDDLSARAARQLLQTTTGSVYAVCPDNCDVNNNRCTFDSSNAGFKCTKCVNNLVVVKGRCACPAGRYLDVANSRCLDCPLGYWCPGGTYDQAQPNAADNVNQPISVQCTGDLITKAKRSKAKNQCVNPPGNYYSTTDPGCSVTAPCAKACPADTFSIGLNKQKACTPCPTGFKTSSTTTGATSSQACMVPPGFYLKTPGQVAPCPRGEYQPTYVSQSTGVGRCTPCGAGITTDVLNAATAQTNCVFTQAGYAPLSADTSVTAVTWLTAAVKCPQNFYCPGGLVTDLMDTNNPQPEQQMFPCTVSGVSGLWTQDVGATSPDECMIPPGYGQATLGAGTITQCTQGSNGQYRDGWLPGNRVGTADALCIACGTNIKGARSDEIIQYTYNSNTNDYDSSSVSVASSSGSCYIDAGMGMYYIAGSGSTDGSYRASACTQANAQYGVASVTYGLAANPCKPCSTGLVITSTSALAYTDATGGITSAAACVTQAGWGWDGRVSTPCPKGSWAAGGDLSPCTECGFGQTTGSAAATASTACALAEGYGSVGGVIQLCPLGTYQAQDGVLPTTNPCSTCPGSKTSTEVGAVDATSDCDACPPGTGAPGPLASDFTGGSCSACTTGTYGPTRQSVDVSADQSCRTCPTSTTGFQFYYNGNEYPYIATPVSKSSAATAGDCLSDYAQISDGLWYFDIGAAISGNPSAGDGNIATCVAQCSADVTCHFATYDYAASSGKCTLYSAATGNSGAILAYKAVPSGDIYAAAESVKAKSATPSGLYTQWTVDSGMTPPGQSATTTASITKEACFNDCDADAECAAVFFVSGSTCKKLKGVATAGAANAAKRSLTRAIPAQAY